MLTVRGSKINLTTNPINVRAFYTEGPIDSRYIFIGRDTGYYGEPFNPAKSSSGVVFEKYLLQLGLKRSEICLMTAYPFSFRDFDIVTLNDNEVKIEYVKGIRGAFYQKFNPVDKFIFLLDSDPWVLFFDEPILKYTEFPERVVYIQDNNTYLVLLHKPIQAVDWCDLEGKCSSHIIAEARQLIYHK